MARENADDKARRYLAESRLRVLYVKPSAQQIRATCRGDGMTYQLGHEPVRGWFCGCPAKTKNCAHLLGLRLVTEPVPEHSF